jgi:hypothetical protein
VSAPLEDAAARSPLTRHQAAVARTLAWADEAAARGDFADALAWLNTLTAIGEPLPARYLLKREDWLGRVQAA